MAQMPGARSMSGQSMNMGHFYGKVINANNNKPLEAASVQLTQNRMDTATKSRRDYVIAAMITDRKGEFSIDKLPVMGNFQILITAIGFAPYNEKVSFLLSFFDFAKRVRYIGKFFLNIYEWYFSTCRR